MMGVIFIEKPTEEIYQSIKHESDEKVSEKTTSKQLESIDDKRRAICFIEVMKKLWARSQNLKNELQSIDKVGRNELHYVVCEKDKL